MSNTTLMQAHHQWATRPADERFASLADLHAAVTRYRDLAAEAPGVRLSTLTAVAEADAEGVERPVLHSATGTRADFTHFSFGQVCRYAGAPASYLRRLPARLAAENLNHGLARYEGETAKLLFACPDDQWWPGDTTPLVLRAATGEGYTRIWNSDVAARLLRLTEQHPEWQPAPPAFDGSRGLYASEKDMFAFLVDNDRRIFESAPGGGLARGFFVSNSEVGDASFRLTTFFYEYVCGNHRVWGAQGVQELRIPHVGRADERVFDRLTVELRKYADASSAEDERKVQAMTRHTLGATKDEVLDAVFGLRIPEVTRKVAEEAYTVAEAHDHWYGSPRTVWGFTGGLTQIARDLPNADDRVALERAAGKIMAIAF